MIVRALGAALFLSVGLSVVSCADPPPLARVHVTITNLHDTLGRDVHDADSASIDVVFPGAGADADGVRRAIYWDLSDRFEFDVQIPAGTYGPPRFQARYFLVCGDHTNELISAEGQASAGFTVLSGTARTDAPPMAAVHLSPRCP